MAEPGHGPDRCNQPSRFASMTNWVRSWKTLQWVVGSNPDRDTENMDSGKTVVLAALGRPFSLGMLYDCRNDSLITAIMQMRRSEGGVKEEGGGVALSSLQPRTMRSVYSGCIAMARRTQPLACSVNILEHTGF
ncbi:unnamed protein product [Boreogadus saida]